MTIDRRTHVLVRCAAIALALGAIACASDSSSGPGDRTRSYYMGFSDFPPAPDTMLLRRTIEMWNTRSDAAIMHIDPPWDGLLAGASSDSLVRLEVLPLVQAYRSLGKTVVIETDVTNGIDRTAEAPGLVALGRSLTEDTVQKLYENYVVSVAAIAQPSYLGLASETNLVRAAGPSGVYAAIVRMTNAAAPRIRAVSSSALYVSVQVDLAWGRLIGGNTYVGVAQDRADFPFIDVLGLSSYPYLGGFTDPAQVPDDYFSRLASDPAIPVLISEGGWSSANVGAVHSSPALQAQWIARAATFADNAHAVAWFQLDFADINLAAFGLDPNDPQVAPFAFIGLVDTTLVPKPALATWDSIFVRRRVAAPANFITKQASSPRDRPRARRRSS
jgi:hypothetical protein